MYCETWCSAAGTPAWWGRHQPDLRHAASHSLRHQHGRVLDTRGGKGRCPPPYTRLLTLKDKKIEKNTYAHGQCCRTGTGRIRKFLPWRNRSLNAFRIRFRNRIWFRSRNKMKWQKFSQSLYNDNFLGINAASNTKKARLCATIFTWKSVPNVV